VVQALLDVVRFWLDRGVDGLRLDTVNVYFTTPSCATTRRCRQNSGRSAWPM